MIMFEPGASIPGFLFLFQKNNSLYLAIKDTFMDKQTIIKLLLEHRESEAISLIFEETGMMSQAKDQVEQIRKELSIFELETKLLKEVISFIEKDQKLQAVKFLVDTRLYGLKDAKDKVDHIQAYLGEKSIPSTGKNLAENDKSRFFNDI